MKNKAKLPRKNCSKKLNKVPSKLRQEKEKLVKEWLAIVEYYRDLSKLPRL